MHPDSPVLKIYCDSSGLIRNHDLHILTSQFNRRRYNASHTHFVHKLLSYLSHNKAQELQYQKFLIYLLQYQYLDYVITMDCTFHEPENPKIINLLGSISKSITGTPDDIVKNICLFGDNIPSDTYLKCYHLLRNCNELLVDNSFLSLQIGQLLVQKHSDRHMILMSSIEKNAENEKLSTIRLTELLHKYYKL